MSPASQLTRPRNAPSCTGSTEIRRHQDLVRREQTRSLAGQAPSAILAPRPILTPSPPCATTPHLRSKAAPKPNRPRNRTPNTPFRNRSASPAATSPALAAAGGNSSVVAGRFVDSNGHIGFVRTKMACRPNLPLMHKSAQLRTKTPNSTAAPAPGTQQPAPTARLRARTL